MMLPEFVKRLTTDLTPQAEVKITLTCFVASKETLTDILSEIPMIDLSDIRIPSEQLNSGMISKFAGISIARDDNIEYGYLEVTFLKDVIMDGKCVYSTMTERIMDLRNTIYKEKFKDV